MTEDKIYQVEKQSFWFNAMLTLIINGRSSVRQAMYFPWHWNHVAFLSLMDQQLEDCAIITWGCTGWGEMEKDKTFMKTISKLKKITFENTNYLSEYSIAALSKWNTKPKSKGEEKGPKESWAPEMSSQNFLLSNEPQNLLLSHKIFLRPFCEQFLDHRWKYLRIIMWLCWMTWH